MSDAGYEMPDVLPSSTALRGPVPTVGVQVVSDQGYEMPDGFAGGAAGSQFSSVDAALAFASRGGLENTLYDDGSNSVA